MTEDLLRCHFCARTIPPSDLVGGRAVIIFQRLYCPLCMTAAVQKGKSSPGERTPAAPPPPVTIAPAIPAPRPAPAPMATRRLKVGEHGCSFYSSEEDRRHHLGPYLREGLESGEKVLHFLKMATPEKILGDFRAVGLAPKPYLDSGQLEIVSVDRLLGKSGAFNPSQLADRILQSADQALEAGYARLRIAGEMTWALNSLIDLASLVDFELKLTELAVRGKCTSLCQYNVYRFESHSLHAIRTRHPFVFVKGTAAMVMHELEPAPH